MDTLLSKYKGKFTLSRKSNHYNFQGRMHELHLVERVRDYLHQSTRNTQHRITKDERPCLLVPGSRLFWARLNNPQYDHRVSPPLSHILPILKVTKKAASQAATPKDATTSNLSLLITCSSATLRALGLRFSHFEWKGPNASKSSATLPGNN